MTTEKANSNLQKTATVWQLIFSLGSVFLIVCAFILTMRADINATIKDNQRQDKLMEEMKKENEKQGDKSDLNQKEILDKLSRIELQVSNKQDRK